MSDIIKVVKANQVLDFCDGNMKKAIYHVDRLLSLADVKNIKRIDFLLDIRNIIKIIG